MGRNLYILAGTFGALAAIAFVLSVSSGHGLVASPGDVALWRMTGLALVCVGLVVALLGVLSALFEQAERRSSSERAEKRRGRSR